MIWFIFHSKSNCYFAPAQAVLLGPILENTSKMLTNMSLLSLPTFPTLKHIHTQLA